MTTRKNTFECTLVALVPSVNSQFNISGYLEADEKINFTGLEKSHCSKLKSI